MVKYVESKSDFKAEQEAAGSKLVVVDFTATWCGPCQHIAPVFEKLADQYKDVCVFLKVDVDEATELSEECGIRSMPTFQFYKNGKMVTQFSGANADKLKETIEAHK
ncbi:thioredoxin-like [Periophthalmus magnuspinnatus]|uniref:thioredoxin-like n=1 Tax=Periophthalmus magnuspinnatus TaxID=409849 RepID=UPI00145B6C3C|nr:thioredoxin-like [Periophthalmus magnuspinnatus]